MNKRRSSSKSALFTSSHDSDLIKKKNNHDRTSLNLAIIQYILVDQKHIFLVIMIEYRVTESNSYTKCCFYNSFSIDRQGKVKGIISESETVVSLMLYR